jgi:alginate O-acetyltransferase complex protein AlgI
MLFDSFAFWPFFGACFVAILVLPHRAQNRVLLVASYAFYAAWDWRFVGLLLVSTLVDYTVGRLLGVTDAPSRRRQLLSVSLFTNLGLLGYFKYAGFFAESLARLTESVGMTLSPFVLDVVLPVGISFYTFQTLSYSIDVYRGSVAPTRNILDFALYVAFFPQLVAGPIERASRLLPQVRHSRELSWERIGSGAWLALWGLVKKVAIADNLGPLVDAVHAPGSDPTGPEVALAMYAFAFQVYCDFSGYTDIARGTARMMGFDLTINFDLPFLARNPQDFWRRWHISLSTWLRDYLFVPLTRRLLRSTHRPFRESAVYLGFFITMTLCGLWHGAAWTFVLFGVFHGVWQCLHDASRLFLPRWSPDSVRVERAWTACKVIVTFHLVCLSFLLFRAENLTRFGELVTALVGVPEVGNAAAWLGPLALVMAPLVLMEIAEALTGRKEVVLLLPAPLRTLTYVTTVIWLAVIGERGGAPFVYFQF